MLRPISFLAAMTLFATGFAGCFGPPQVHPTATTPVPPNACTPYVLDGIEPAQQVRGQNAFEFMIGLVCDHSGASPQERPRVPGTPQHLEAARYMHDALQEHSDWSVGYQNFTGAAYQAIMREAERGSYHHWFENCDESDRQRVRELHFYNIEARGGTVGGPIFLLMAHWDSKRHAMDTGEAFVSANDGPSGVGVLLEMARVLSDRTLSYEVRILLTDGEDGFEDCHPLAGSTYYAETLSTAERTRMRSIVLLDMVGDPNATFYKGCGTDHALADRIWSKAAELGVSQFKQQGRCNGTVDDHTPFEERGMPAVDIIDTGRPSFTPYWHTQHDTPDKVSPLVLEGVGRVVTAIVMEPA